MARYASITRALSVAALGLGVATIGWRGEQRPAAPKYTIAFKSFAPNNTDIFIADANGGHVRPFLPNAALDYDASFSADGQWGIFTSHRSGPAKIYLAHPDGSSLEA